MNKLNKYSLLLTLTLLMAALTIAPAFVVPVSAQTATEWSMFMGNPAHTGISPANPWPGTWMVGWQYEGADASYRSSAAIVAGKVYLGNDDSKMRCLSLADGTLLWEYETRGGGIYSSPCVVGGKVYFGAFDHYIYCLDANSGSEVWEYQTGAYIYSSPVVVDGKVYIGSTDSNLYCLDAATGALIWKFKTGDSIYNVSPAVVDGYIYIASVDWFLYKLNMNGTMVWKFQSKGNVPAQTGSTGGFYHSSPVVVGGSVYIGSDDQSLYKVNATTGNQTWNYLPNSEYLQKTYGIGVQNSYMESTVCVKDGLVYTNFAHAMIAIDDITGKEVWLTKTGSVSYGGVGWANGKIYTGSSDQYWYEWDALTGERLQSFSGMPRGAFKVCPAIVDGHMVVGCSNNIVYCFVPGIQTGISRWVSPSVITLGQSVSVGGGILPAVSGATVTLTYRAPDLAETIQEVTTAADGTYSSSFTPTVQTGLWEVTPSYAGDATHGRTQGFPQFFTVEAVKPGKMSTTISCSVTPTSSKVGDTVTVAGNISPAVGGVVVTLTITKPDATHFTKVASSGAGGAYTSTFKPDAAGTWSVKASWVGSASYAESTSSAATETVTEAAVGPAEAAGIAPEIIYGGVAVVVIAIVGVAAYLFMKRKK